MERARGLEKIEVLGEVDELQRRYSILERRLRMLNREGPGFLRNIRAALARTADDFTGTVGDFVIRLDSYRHARSSTQSKTH